MAGRSRPTKIPIMAMTTSNSTSVKPGNLRIKWLFFISMAETWKDQFFSDLAYKYTLSWL
jgi:hypothetical protein